MENIYAYWLHNIPGIGNRSIKNLLDYAGSPEEIYGMNRKELLELLPEKQAEEMNRHRMEWKLEKEYESLNQKGIGFYHKGHPQYPRRLLQIPDAPFGIYVLGKLPLEGKRSVAVIGARSCSEYGRHLAGRYGKELTKAGIQVISGMAWGIDGISQRAALEAGGSSYAVLGCGADICYPRENEDIYGKMIEAGGILSEYPPGTPPRANHFPPRNRIISGLADAVLVIEAKEKSGTLITVDMALEQGREVYAVPGRVTDALSFGCNHLLKQGAALALSPQELVEELLDNAPSPIDAPKKNQEHHRTTVEEQLLPLLDDTLKPPSRIYEELQKEGVGGNWTVPVLMQNLLQLQIAGEIKQEAGCYCLNRKI